MKTFDYFALVRKYDNKEVYSSPKYVREDCTDVLDTEKIQEGLNFYFKRVNSGIEQQLNSPKLTEEQKKELKLLDKNDYFVRFVQYNGVGYFQKIYWTKEANEFLK